MSERVILAAPSRLLRVLLPFAATAAVVTLAGCGQQEQTSSSTAAPVAEATTAPQLTPVATVRQLMLAITIPMSNVVFQVGENTPTDDAGWEVVQNSALALAESGNLLLIGSRVPDDQGDWVKYSRALIDTSTQAAQAAQAKDVDKVLDIGNQIYETCDGCHAKYMPARAGEQSAPQSPAQ